MWTLLDLQSKLIGELRAEACRTRAALETMTQKCVELEKELRACH